MFKIVAEPTFTVTVTVLVPSDGGHDKQTLKATYKVLKTDEFDAFNLDSALGSTEFLKAAIVKLDDLADEHGEPVPYNDKLRDELIRVPYVRTALAKSYLENVNKAARGN